MSLIVIREDDQTLSMLVSAVLRKNGHVVYTASGGIQGLELVRKHRATFGFFRDRRPELYGRLVEDI